MSVSPLRLEVAILRAVAIFVVAKLQCTYAELGNRVAEVDAEAANENINLVTHTVVSLGVQRHLDLAKIEAGRRFMFDFQRQKDDKYLNEFFGVGTFDLRLTHDGKKRVEQPIDPKLDDDFPTTLETVRGELDYWAKRQREGQPGSEFHSRVTDRPRISEISNRDS